MKLPILTLLALTTLACGSGHSGQVVSSATPSPTPVSTGLPASDDTLPSVAGVVIGDPRPVVSIDPVLGTLLTQFKADLKSHGMTLPTNVPELRTVDFMPMLPGVVGGDVLGYCQTMQGLDASGVKYQWNVLHIQVPKNSALAQTDTDYTESATSFDLKVMAYHEFGHCMLGKNHTTIATAITSIMYADMIPVTDHSDAAWKALVDEYLSADYQASLPDLTY